MLDRLRDLHCVHLSDVEQVAAEALLLHEERQFEQEELSHHFERAICHDPGQRRLTRVDHLRKVPMYQLLLVRGNLARALLHTLREYVVEVDEAFPEESFWWCLEATHGQILHRL